MNDTDDKVKYYRVHPKGFFSSLLSVDILDSIRVDGGQGGGSIAAGGGAAEADPARRGWAFWALIGIAGVILVMVVAIILLSMGDRSIAAAPSPGVGISWGATTNTTEPEEIAVAIIPPTTETTVAGTTGSTVYTNPMNNPVRIVIPAINAAANIIPVGVEKEGVMEVPPAQKAGWYKLGPVPGASGPSVIVAHVYYNHERDVFYNLRRLQPGDEIQVYDGSGDVAVFVVDSKEEVLKSELPGDKIWNKTSDPVIRLITCGGTFDPVTRHFLSNVIVYGHLVQ